jgi:hypothetical protein
MISASTRITNSSRPVIPSVGRSLSSVEDLRGEMRAHIVAEIAAEKEQHERRMAALSRHLDQGIDSMGNYLTDTQTIALWTGARATP